VCPIGMPRTTVSVKFVNTGPKDLPYAVRNGSIELSGRLRAQSHLSLELPYHADSGEIVIETETWCPATDIPGSTDNRQLGIGVLEARFS
jgi:hypothetical protein